MRNSQFACDAAPAFGASEPAPRRLAGGVPGTRLDDAVLIALRALINRVGIQAAARALGFPPSTVANGAAGAGMRMANRALLSQRLAALKDGAR